MFESINILPLILGISFVTYTCRASLFWIMKKRKLPKFLIDLIEFIPVCVFASLIFPAVFNAKNRVGLEVNSELVFQLISCLIIVLVYKLTKKPYLAFFIATATFCFMFFYFQ